MSEQPAEVTTTTTTTTPAPPPQQEPAPDNGGTDVAASFSAVPPGVPNRAPARTSQVGALDAFVRTVCDAFRPGGGGRQAITAALTDVTYSAHNDVINPPAWSGELWSGVQYEQEYVPLLAKGNLTSLEGKGWRFVTKPQMQDYAGDKAAIPSGPIMTEPSEYTANRKAVGHDIDRAFFDFPNEAFLRGYAEACRESWAMETDFEVIDWIVDHAVGTLPDGVDGGTAPDVATAPTLFRAVAIAMNALRRTRVGRGTFVLMNDVDHMDLFDVTAFDVPAFLKIFNVDPSNWIPTDRVAAGTVIVGAKQAATYRELPGSPIRVDAQNIGNGGVDSGFFGYWAVEQHHKSGIVKVGYTG